MVQGMKRKGLSEASQRYGTRALHRCLQAGTCTRPSRNLAAPEEVEKVEEVEEVEKVEKVEKVEGNHEAGTGNMGSVETSQVVLEETTDATREDTTDATRDTTRDTTRKDDDGDEAPSATSLLLDFVPLLLSLLTASVDEHVNGASGGASASGVALADVRLHLSPELSLLHHVVVHGGSVECVLHGAMGVLGEVLACLNVALANPTKGANEGEGEGEGGGAVNGGAVNGGAVGGGAVGGGALNELLLANVATAAECAIELLNVATSGDR